MFKYQQVSEPGNCLPLVRSASKTHVDTFYDTGKERGWGWGAPPKPSRVGQEGHTQWWPQLIKGEDKLPVRQAGATVLRQRPGGDSGTEV